MTDPRKSDGVERVAASTVRIAASRRNRKLAVGGVLLAIVVAVFGYAVLAPYFIA